MKPATLDDCFRIYLQQASFRSEHTLSAYKRAVELFFQYLDDPSVPQTLPIQRKGTVSARLLTPQDFSADDEPILSDFTAWLATTPSQRLGRGDKRPYARATIELRVAGVHHWLGYMQAAEWLTEVFDLNRAYQLFREQLEDIDEQRTKPVIKTTHDLTQVMMYYDHLIAPRHLHDDPERFAHWDLVRLRNRAFLHSLGDTGGRVSELLSLNLSHIPIGRRPAKAIQITVLGKSNHPYKLYVQKSLPALHAYITARQQFAPDEPLFISHDERYLGARMSRIVAWRLVRRAAHAMDMGDLSPQDFRHWRALQLIGEGATVQEVRDILGHRSIETVRTLYAEAWANRGDNQ